jgi:hypothetical protein
VLRSTAETSRVEVDIEKMDLVSSAICCGDVSKLQQNPALADKSKLSHSQENLFTLVQNLEKYKTLRSTDVRKRRVAASIHRVDGSIQAMIRTRVSDQLSLKAKPLSNELTQLTAPATRNIKTASVGERQPMQRILTDLPVKSKVPLVRHGEPEVEDDIVVCGRVVAEDMAASTKINP